jgi:hypothetical protein
LQEHRPADENEPAAWKGIIGRTPSLHFQPNLNENTNDLGESWKETLRAAKEIFEALHLQPGEAIAGDDAAGAGGPSGAARGVRSPFVSSLQICPSMALVSSAGPLSDAIQVAADWAPLRAAFGRPELAVQDALSQESGSSGDGVRTRTRKVG